MKFQTRTIHGGYSPDRATGAIATPLYQSNIYAFESIARYHRYPGDDRAGQITSPADLVSPTMPDFDARIAFSGLDANIAGEKEPEFDRAGYAVVINAPNYGMEDRTFCLTFF